MMPRAREELKLIREVFQFLLYIISTELTTQMRLFLDMTTSAPITVQHCDPGKGQ